MRAEVLGKKRLVSSPGTLGAGFFLCALRAWGKKRLVSSPGTLGAGLLGKKFFMPNHPLFLEALLRLSFSPFFKKLIQHFYHFFVDQSIRC